MCLRLNEVIVIDRVIRLERDTIPGLFQAFDQSLNPSSFFHRHWRRKYTLAHRKRRRACPSPCALFAPAADWPILYYKSVAAFTSHGKIFYATKLWIRLRCWTSIVVTFHSFSILEGCFFLFLPPLFLSRSRFATADVRRSHSRRRRFFFPLHLLFIPRLCHPVWRLHRSLWHAISFIRDIMPEARGFGPDWYLYI